MAKMRVYLLSLGAGLLVGVIYSLLNVRSPAPPVVALVGLLGILIGEQIAKHMLTFSSFAASLGAHGLRCDASTRHAQIIFRGPFALEPAKLRSVPTTKPAPCSAGLRKFHSQLRSKPATPTVGRWAYGLAQLSRLSKR
jgi:XapX domain-containing protein